MMDDVPVVRAAALTEVAMLTASSSDDGTVKVRERTMCCCLEV
jgi:hypothetical protein